MTSEKTLTLSHTELRMLLVRCQTPGCGGEITVDLNNATQRERFRASPTAPATQILCLFCNKTFDISIRMAIDGLCQFQHHLSGSTPDAVRFKILEG